MRLFALAFLVLASSLPAQKTLLATPETVLWGNYNGAAKPALTIASGETVTIQTLSTCGSPARLEGLGIAASDIPQYVRDIYDKFPASEKGPGGHILTGPVAIEGTEPGDVLRSSHPEDTDRRPLVLQLLRRGTWLPPR